MYWEFGSHTDLYHKTIMYCLDGTLVDSGHCYSLALCSTHTPTCTMSIYIVYIFIIVCLPSSYVRYYGISFIYYLM